MASWCRGSTPEIPRCERCATGPDAPTVDGRQEAEYLRLTQRGVRRRVDAFVALGFNRRQAPRLGMTLSPRTGDSC